MTTKEKLIIKLREELFPNSHFISIRTINRGYWRVYEGCYRFIANIDNIEYVCSMTQKIALSEKLKIDVSYSYNEREITYDLS